MRHERSALTGQPSDPVPPAPGYVHSRGPPPQGWLLYEREYVAGQPGEFAFGASSSHVGAVLHAHASKDVPSGRHCLVLSERSAQRQNTNAPGVQRSDEPSEPDELPVLSLPEAPDEPKEPDDPEDPEEPGATLPPQAAVATRTAETMSVERM